MCWIFLNTDSCVIKQSNIHILVCGVDRKRLVILNYIVLLNYLPGRIASGCEG